MKKIYKILFLLLLTIFVYTPELLAKNNNDSDKNSGGIIRSIWKYEQNSTKYSPEDGVAKKIFFLSLNSDGTYHQYVQVVPLTPQDYFRVKNYTLDGKWTEKDGKLVLEEYGKERTIDYNFLYSNFENIDNQYITTKK